MPLPRKVASALEIVRAYVEVYTKVSYALGLMAQLEGKPMTRKFADGLLPLLNGVVKECEGFGFFCTLESAKTLVRILSSPKTWNRAEVRATFSHETIVMHDSLDIELSHRMFFRMSESHAKYFLKPLDGWEEIVQRFPECITDIHEAHKCFALSRYAATVFHSVMIVEFGLIELGRFLRVNDPMSGWTAVSRALAMIEKKHHQRTRFEKKHIQFIEQVNGLIQALKNAWRNKISHAHGRLIVMNSEFAPDVAEEILFATRGLMRRLAQELPSKR
jgi:hypothetical protein